MLVSVFDALPFPTVTLVWFPIPSYPNPYFTCRLLCQMALSRSCAYSYSLDATPLATFFTRSALS